MISNEDDVKVNLQAADELAHGGHGDDSTGDAQATYTTRSYDKDETQSVASAAEVEMDEKYIYRQEVIAKMTKLFVAVLLLTWMIGALAHNSEKAVDLGVVYIVVAIFFFWGLGAFLNTKMATDFVDKASENIESQLQKKFVQRVILLLCVILVVASFAATYDNNSSRFVSLLGLAVFIFLCWAFSWHRSKVIWRPVIGGFVLQFILALFILRSQAGYDFFDFIGDQVSVLLEYTTAGSSFVYGYLATGLDISEASLGLFDANVTDINGIISEVQIDAFGIKLGGGYKDFGVFFFSVLSTVIFFSSLVSVLFYLGFLQAIIYGLGRVMAVALGTSASESLSAAGNIFVGQTEAPLLVRPFLAEMTDSELHAVMTGGFATIAGGVLAVYIFFGVSATHLLSASVMSAPAALAISKLIVPETEVSKTAAGTKFRIETMKETNVIEAASNGAAVAVMLVLNIGAQLIAFLALVAMFDAWLGFVGLSIGEELSFKIVCGWIFYPFAYLMGVDVPDCVAVAELLGTKLFINEFVAYEDLSVMIKAGTLTDRSEVIATYALCGFANFGSIGIQLGGLGALAPNKTGRLAKLVFSAMIAGNVACFMTASIAGMLYDVERTRVT